MRIVVNDIAASTGGALSILRDFYEYIRENDRGNEWIFLLGDRYIEETENIRVLFLPEVKRSRLKKLRFDFLTGRRFVSALQPDVVFSLQNILTFGLDVPQLVYVHQSIPFQTGKRFSFLKEAERPLAVYQYLIGAIIKHSVKKADRVFVQTQWLKEAVCRMCGVREEKVTCVLPSVRELSAFRRENEFQRNRFIYPTSPLVYKNNDCIYRAAALLRKSCLEDFEINLTLDDASPAENVRHIGRLQREELLLEYNRATLLFPSYIESFGYPLAEARRLGTVILASDHPFSREILAGYANAYFFDPFRPEELANLMQRVLQGEIAPRKNPTPAESAPNGWAAVVEAILAAGRSHAGSGR